MKKSYEKPSVALVSFALSSNIAGACALFLEYEELKQQGFFAEGSCTVGYTCYHVPTEEISEFNS